MPSSRIAPDKLKAYEDEVVRVERDYLRVNTSNPPGNEIQAAQFFKRILDAEGIPSQIFEYSGYAGSGHANIIARLKGNGSKRPLILLNHMDVVTSDPQRWKVSPFSGEVQDNYIFGRGAQDMKSDGIAQLMTMLLLKRENVPLDRDVIFLATADEEVNDSGSEWMIKNHKDLFSNAEYLLTEGGENLVESGKMKFIGVDVAEKSPFWLHIIAHGRPGHGSRPLADSAPNQLVRSLNKLITYKTEMKVIPTVDEFLKAMAGYESPARARQFRNIRSVIKDPAFQAEISKDESLNYLFRNTVSLTMLGGSQQTNVIPGEAWANVDVRLLPGDDPKQFLETIRKAIAEPNVTVDPLNAEFRPANESSTNTELFGIIRQVSKHYWDDAPVAPRLTSGYTENQMYRQLGIVCYGFSPYAETAEEGSTAHGDNERIPVSEVRQAFRVLFDVVTLAASHASGSSNTQ